MKKIAMVVFLFFAGWSFTASSALTIEITQGMQGAAPIAIVPFAGSGNEPQDVADIITADLRSSGRFAPVSHENMVARPATPEQVRFQDWRTLGVENLVIGVVESA
ncbi:MAG: Tol-Pal system protein TolB, partial [Gammaproteobacteria bacterium]